MNSEKNMKMTIRDMDFYYGNFQALKNINYDIIEKEVLAFIGPSGCGKSTMLRSLNRINDLIKDSKVTGTITLDGEDIYAQGYDVIELRRKVGMVFQKPNPFPKSIYDNVAYGPRLNGIKKKSELDEIVERSLIHASLWSEVKNKLHDNGLSISGGQQQRLCIARVLAVEPDVILMDEPTSSLDPISTLKIEDLIFSLKKDYTIVIVTHNMQQAARVSDKTAYYLLGEIIEFEKTVQLFENPRDKRTEDYITGRFG